MITEEFRTSHRDAFDPSMAYDVVLNDGIAQRLSIAGDTPHHTKKGISSMPFSFQLIVAVVVLFGFGEFDEFIHRIRQAAISHFEHGGIFEEIDMSDFDADDVEARAVF